MPEGQRRRYRAAAWGVVAVLVLVTVVEGFDEARRVRSDIEVGTSSSRRYRELQPARTVGLTDLRVFLRAEQLIPRDATFFVATGDGAAVSDPRVLRWVRPFARYRLYPRRLTISPRRADWILTYGTDA